VNSDKLISELSRDWEWLSFVTQYCAGRNVGKAFCEDFMWWALGAAALAVAIVAWWIFGRLARVYGNWKHRKMQAEVADAETMKKHAWSGHATHDEQRAAKSRRPEKS
jgi:ABC-type nickel/cobalt efflux system permease component RcnA